MNAQNLRKAQSYRLLAVFCGLKPESVKKWFSRNGSDVLNPEACFRFMYAHHWTEDKNSVRIEWSAEIRIMAHK